MRDMTAANLRSAFGGESQAHMRYIIWGNVADTLPMARRPISVPCAGRQRISLRYSAK